MRTSTWKHLFLGAGFGLAMATSSANTVDSAAPPDTRSASGRSGGASKQPHAEAPKGEAGTYGQKETYPHSAGVPTTSQIAGGSVQSSGEPIAPSASVIENRIREWKLGARDIQADLEAGRPIMRSKSIGVGEPTGQEDDTALETLINNRLLADSETVRVTTKIKAHRGEVDLGGRAATAELIGRAIAVVLDTKGVTKVTANMTIDPLQPGSPRDDAARIQQNNAAK